MPTMINKAEYRAPETLLFSISSEGRICGLSDNDPFITVPGGSLDD